MKNKAIVLSTDGLTAVVEVERLSACDSCHKADSGACTVCSLVGGSVKKTSARAKNPIGAKAGDLVYVESSSKRMLLYAACLFLLPLLLFAAGFGIAALFTKAMWIRFVSGLFGVLLTYIGAAIYSKTVVAKREDVEIVGFVDPEES